MLFLGGAGVVFELLLLVYCVLNVATTAPGSVRNLPKPTWLLLVILFPLIGGIAWLVAGRPRPAAVAPGGQAATPTQRRPTAPPGPVRPTSPDDDEAFLRSLRQRAQEQRDRAERDGPGDGLEPR